jgi:hypothetical protein
MSIKNRELSQFASLLRVTDVGKDISIAPDQFSFVGIGTDDIQYKLHVIGDSNISGSINIGGDSTFGGDLILSGIMTASEYYDTFGNKLTSFDTWTISGPNIYRLNSVGIGTSNITERLTVFGNILVNGNNTSNQFISTTTTQQPLVVSSQQRVINLNADYLREGIPGGNSPFDIVTVAGSQSLSNKILVSPNIQGTLVFGNVNLTSTIGGTFNVTMPTSSGRIVTDQETIVGLVTTGRIQDGTILNQDIADLTITGSKIANNTLPNNKLQNSTISGISLGANLNSLTINSPYLSSPIVYNGSTAVTRTFDINATPDNIANTIVQRNISGNFSASQINVESLVATNTVTAQDFNSTSDINLKKDIRQIKDSSDILDNINGVRFNWKKDNLPSMGVIAQELEQVAPELVHTVYGNKTVNYNGIIAILLESIKELREEVKILKENINP